VKIIEVNYNVNGEHTIVTEYITWYLLKIHTTYATTSELTGTYGDVNWINKTTGMALDDITLSSKLTKALVHERNKA